jgi:uncharacterized phage-associated protein
MDVLAYMRALGHTFNGEFQAQKLAYYAQAWSVAWDGAPLFDESIEAWRMGPVVRSVRYALDVRQPAPNPEAPLTPQQKENIKAVLRYYGRMSGADLADLTHAESPWKTVWGDRRPHDTCSDPIPLDLMRREYTRQSIEGKGPERVALGARPAEPVDVRRLAEEANRRWSRTMALLAE